jgi:hypothetical protein
MKKTFQKSSNKLENNKIMYGKIIGKYKKKNKREK